MRKNKNNNVVEVGRVITDLEFDHEIMGEKFYNGKISVARESETEDILPFIISERLLNGKKLPDYVRLEGEIRTYNEHGEDGRNHLKVFLFVFDWYEIEELSFTNSFNEVELIGHICKAPIYRQTPKGKEITDVTFAVNRPYGKSDYIPCIAWGRNARAVAQMAVSTKLSIKGRFQSREYTKQHNGTVETRTAYEVSIGTFTVLEEKEDSKNE